LIVVPLILGAIYLPVFIKSVVNPYQDLLNTNNELQNVINNPNPGMDDLLNQAQKFLNENSKK